MTTQTHEERKAVAHAAIDGAQIEYLDALGRWENAFVFGVGHSFYMHTSVAYRIKPERKPNAVNVGYCCVDESGLPGLTTTRQYPGDTHKMTIETDPNETPPKVVSITLEPLK